MNPYLSAGFRPVDEERALDEVALEGDWPDSLEGTLYRIGPNPRFPPIEPYNPLQGDGMVHAFRISGRRVGYRNRWVRTQQWRLEDAAGRALFATADRRGHDPSVAHLDTDGVANTHLVRHAGRLLVLEDGHAPMELDPRTLATRGVWRFGGALRANMTAHPKVDLQTGEMLFFANEPGRRFDGEIIWYVAAPDGRIVLERTIRAPYASVVHDFAITRDYIVFLLGPVTVSLARVRAGAPPLAWEPARSAYMGIVHRDGTGEVSWVATEARYVWHVANAWNEGSRITVDLCEQRAPAFPLPDGSMTVEVDWCQRFTRWVCDAGDEGTIETRRMSELVCEYPRIDDRFVGQRTRHTYFACHGGPGTGDRFHRGIAHFDAVTGGMQTYRFGDHSAVSEPVFVPRSAGAAEGEGWLLCVVYEEARDRSLLALLDAGGVERGPLALARLPFRVPMGFHGCWVAGSDLVAPSPDLLSRGRRHAGQNEQDRAGGDAGAVRRAWSTQPGGLGAGH